MHPGSKHWHLLDYIIVRQCDVRDVVHTRVMPSADCYTDHRLVRTKLNIAIKMVKKDGLPRAKKLNVDRLADVRERFSALLEADLRKPQDDDPVSNWSQLKAILQDVTAKVVGYCSKPNRDWFDENNTAIKELLMNKHKYYRSVLANLITTQPELSIKLLVTLCSQRSGN
ncbi:craniofacial development protein 2 [Biomphalaria glabrata]|nr:craniofacial development protein 2 [Biomphalaria glabrata]